MLLASGCTSGTSSSEPDSTEPRAGGSGNQSSSIQNLDQENAVVFQNIEVIVPANSFTEDITGLILNLNSIEDHENYTTLTAYELQITDSLNNPVPPSAMQGTLTLNLAVDSSSYNASQLQMLLEYEGSSSSLSSEELSVTSERVTYALTPAIATAANGVSMYLISNPSGGSGGGGSSQTHEWSFASAGNYSFNSSEIGVSAGLASLQGEDLTDDANDASGFATASFEGSEWHVGNSAVQPIGDPLPFANSGSTSDVYDMTSNSLLLHLDESSGSIADSSSNGLSGTPNGITYSAAGQVGTAITFGGTTDTIDFADNDDLDMDTTGFYSVSVWFKTTNGGSPNILEKREAVFPNKGFFLALNGGKPRWFIDDDNWNDSGAIGTVNYNDGVWHHMVWVVDRNAELAHVYMDGEPNTVNINISGASGDANSSAVLRVGGHKDNTNSWVGELDELGIFKREITADEARKIYEAQKGQYGAVRSRIMGGTTSRTWTQVDWEPSRPILKPIPCNRVTETAYSSSNFTMASSLLLLAHFDDASWVGAGDVSDCANLSSPNNGTAQGNTVQNSSGRFGKAAYFDGSNDYIEFANESNFDFAVTDSFTLAAWIKTTTNIATIVGKFDYTGTPRRGYNLLVEGTGEITFDLFSSVTGPDNKLKKTDDRVINDNKWHHVAVTYDGSASGAGINIYVDGTVSGGATVNFDTLTTSHEVRQNQPLRVGMSEWTSHSYEGLIDEVGVWNDELSAADIMSLYERGADELRFQVRTCPDAACAGEPTFLGPDGTANTFYDETSNNAIALPSLGLTNLAANNYFQYLAIFRDEPATTSLPELSSITISPSNFTSNSPSITSQSGIAYSTLSGFRETLGGSNQGTVSYQLSNNGTNWYHYDSGTWTAAATASDSNSASDINTNISSFPSSVGTGTLFIKAFLNSNGSQTVELDRIEVDYN